MNQEAGSDPCPGSYPSGKITDSKILGGTARSYDREASLFQICEGFGGPDESHFTLTPTQQCAIIAAAATYGGPAYNPAGISGVCAKADIVQTFLDHDWLGAVKGFACGYFGDIFAGSVAVFVAGATSETGPGAVAVGVATYRALAGSLTLVCGGVFTAVGTPLGRKLETEHETAVMIDILKHGKCLHETQRTVIGIQWSAVACPSKVYEVSLGAIAPNHGGLLDDQTARSSNVTPPINPFPYDVSTLDIGEAPCTCVPPITPVSLTLAAMAKTSCKSISLKVYSPWAPGEEGGADEVQIVQPGRATATTEVTSAAQMSSLTAQLSGGPWELTTSELSPAVSGDQATVFVRGTLTCSTRNGG